MTERPILFNGAMVRAILEGRKTQTRRVMKPQPVRIAINAIVHEPCPYGNLGDELWVRETIRKAGEFPDGYASSEYVADGAPTVADAWPWQRRTLAAIHCPRGLSRILLEITDVRVQRVQEISEEDARAEGVLWVSGHGEITAADLHEGYSNYLNCRQGFQVLWDSINAKRGFAWDANPFVWCVTFKRVDEAKE